MTRTTMWIAATVLVVAVVAGAWLSESIAKGTFRYRLTATVESGGQTYTGSGVIQVRMNFQEYWSPPALPRVTGDAVVVEVPGHEPIFFLLTSDWSVDWDAAIPFATFEERFTDPRTIRGDTRTLAALRETATIPPERYPLIVAFRDLAQPDSVYEVFPDDLSPPLDAGARVVGLTIEMTRDPPTTGIEQRLPWLVGMGGTLDGRSIHVAGGPLANELGAAAFTKRGL